MLSGNNVVSLPEENKTYGSFGNDKEAFDAYKKGGLIEVKKLWDKRNKINKNRLDILQNEVELVVEFEDLHLKDNKTNEENNRIIELFSLLSNSKEVDFNYTLNKLNINLNDQSDSITDPFEDNQPKKEDENNCK